MAYKPNRPSSLILKGQNGQSLVSVIVGIGISSIVMYTMMAVTQNSMRAQTTVSMNAEIADYISMLELQMANSTLCSSMLSLSPASTVSVGPGQGNQVMVSLSGLPNLPPGITLVQQNMPLINNWGGAVGIAPTNSMPSGWPAQLMLTFQKSSSGSLGGTQVTRPIPLNLREPTAGAWTPASGGNVTVSGCSSAAAAGGSISMSSLCGTLGFNYTPANGSVPESCQPTTQQACLALGGIYTAPSGSTLATCAGINSGKFLCICGGYAQYLWNAGCTRIGDNTMAACTSSITGQPCNNMPMGYVGAVPSGASAIWKCLQVL